MSLLKKGIGSKMRYTVQSCNTSLLSQIGLTAKTAPNGTYAELKLTTIHFPSLL